MHYVVLLSEEGSGRFYVDADLGEACTRHKPCSTTMREVLSSLT